MGYLSFKLRDIFARWSRADWSSGAQDFEAHYNMTGIAGAYRFPRNQTMAHFSRSLNYCGDVFELYESCFANWPRGPILLNAPQIKTAPSYLVKRLTDDWRALQSLNPSLQIVKAEPEQPIIMMEALIGAGYGFNPDDINLFCQLRSGPPTRVSTHDRAMALPGYAEKYKAVLEYTGPSGPGWVTAPQTLQKMAAQFKARQPQ